MSLLAHSELLARQRPSGSYVVDTSFLIAAGAGGPASGDSRYRTAFKLKRHLMKHGVGLFYTGIIRSELNHKLRAEVFSAALKTGFRSYPKLRRCYQDAGGREPLKEILKSGYVESFAIALGEEGKTLRKEHDALTFGCTYVKTEEMKMRPIWDDVFKLMALYGLDSTDAMILNYAITQKTFNGLITMDSDFRFCSDVDNFDIVVPHSVSNLSPAVAPA